VTAVTVLAFLAACSNAPAVAPAPKGEAMVAAADPLAVDAGLEMLRAGGSAIDAAIAVEVTLGLVESGIVWRGRWRVPDPRCAADGAAIDAYDGREWAPAGATPDMFLVDGKALPFELAQASGKSIGTPALIPMLKMVHEHHGKLAWAKLFEPGDPAWRKDGFVVGTAAEPDLRRRGRPCEAEVPGARDLSRCGGQALAAGTRAAEPGTCAQTLRPIAGRIGAGVLTHGRHAQEGIVAAVASATARGDAERWR